ncbi:solute carrier family 49 member A3-like [Ptychodera flava]|uniref:solute carrier family 49 member A3-like n=1 Tax=Ptychodera flava TaxID=63121 RepID=UPI00396A62E0
MATASINEVTGPEMDRLSDPLLRTPTSLSSSYSEDQAVYRVYKRRWYMLSVLCVLNIANAMIWLTFSPIADKAGEYYHVDYNKINMLSLIFMIVSIPLGLCASWLLDTFGLRASIIFGSWLNLFGAAVRVLSTFDFIPHNVKYPLVLTGQGIAACSQPFILFSPTKLAATWFQDNQRATANMIASISNPLGILVANVLSPFLTESAKDLQFTLCIYCIPAGVGMLMATCGFCSSHPPTPPSASAADVHEPFFTGLKKIIQNKAYLILAFSFGGGIALFSTLTTLFQQILCPQGYNDDEIGIYGALMIFSGIIGAGFAGAVVDKTKKFMETAKISYGLAAVSCSFLAVISQQPNQTILTGVASGLVGFFSFALLPVCLELGVECTYPVAEGTSAGLLFTSGQIQGIAYVYIMQGLGRHLTPSQLETQQCTNSSLSVDIQPKDMTISVLVFAGMASFAAAIFIIFFYTDYKRLKAEECEAAERILNFSSSTPSFPRRTIQHVST